MGRLIVINRGGNNFRLIAKVTFSVGATSATVFFRSVLPHAEYAIEGRKHDPWFYRVYDALVTRFVPRLLHDAQDYESVHHPVLEVSGVEMLKFLMDQHGLKRKDLVETFMTPSILSEVPSGKRELNKAHTEGLSRRFHVSPAVFFGADQDLGRIQAPLQEAERRHAARETKKGLKQEG